MWKDITHFWRGISLLQENSSELTTAKKEKEKEKEKERKKSALWLDSSPKV
jgi:hypothetical protein